MQQEIGEAVADATNRFKARHPNPEDWRSSKLKDQVSLALVKVRRRHFRSWRCTCRLRIQEMEMHSWSKSNIITRAGSTTRRWPKRSCGTCRLVECGLKLRPNGWRGGIKALQPALREAVKFPPQKFSDASFQEWLKRATWWDQVCLNAF